MNLLLARQFPQVDLGFGNFNKCKKNPLLNAVSEIFSNLNFRKRQLFDINKG